MIELEHSPLGGSGAKRWLNCGTSFLLQRQLMLRGEYEQPPSSIFADKGTAAHELGAMCLAQHREPFEFIRQKIGDYTVHPDDLDPDAVAVYVATCEAIAEGAAGDPTAHTLVEQTLHLPEIHPLFKGTVDFGHWRFQNDPGVWLIDYKNGEGVGVETFQNPQLLYYGVLFILKFPELRDLPRDFPVYLGIVQPNFYGLFEEPDIWITNVGAVLEWGHSVLLPSMQRLLDDRREEFTIDDFVSGDHCLFCPVMLECPKLRKAFETFAHGDDFLAMLTNQELSDLYALRDDARRYGNELEKVVYARKISGAEIPSAKLVEKRTHRAWKSGAEQEAARRFGDQAYNPRKLKSPAQMEKLSSGGKAFALEYGFKPESDRYTIAPISDPRPEAKPPSNSEIFKDFAVPLEDLGW